MVVSLLVFFFEGWVFYFFLWLFIEDYDGVLLRKLVSFFVESDSIEVLVVLVEEEFWGFCRNSGGFGEFLLRLVFVDI